jgi:ketosteroid isomerase-like protein
MDDSTCFATPQDAEAAFYDAFERADIAAMMTVWAADNAVVCIHPGGPRLQGLNAVKDGWKSIFATDERFGFTLTENHYTQDGPLAIHLVKENIQIDSVLRGVVLATNIYQFIEGSWRMRLHHASPDPESIEEIQQTKTLH